MKFMKSKLFKRIDQIFLGLIMALMVFAVIFCCAIRPASAENFTEQQIANLLYTSNQEFAYDANDNLEYWGRAPAGAATTDGRWLILKFTWSDGKVTSIKSAGSSWVPNKVWVLYSSYTY